MRMILIVTAATLACAGAALAAEPLYSAPTPGAPADDGSFLYDGVDPVRRDYQPNSPIITIDADDLLDVIDGSGYNRNGPIPAEVFQRLQREGNRLIAQAEADAVSDAGASAPVIALNGVRVAAVDTEALAEFYKTAFGMVEVNRIPIGEHPEIMVNFGATPEQGIANPNGDVVIYPRASDDVDDPIPHVIFNVSDAAQVVADVVAAGGAVVSEPREFGNTGIVIAMVNDPAGNQIELIEGLEN